MKKGASDKGWLEDKQILGFSNVIINTSPQNTDPYTANSL